MPPPMQVAQPPTRRPGGRSPGSVAYVASLASRLARGTRGFRALRPPPAGACYFLAPASLMCLATTSWYAANHSVDLLELAALHLPDLHEPAALVVGRA